MTLLWIDYVDFRLGGYDLFSFGRVWSAFIEFQLVDFGLVWFGSVLMFDLVLYSFIQLGWFDFFYRSVWFYLF